MSTDRIFGLVRRVLRRSIDTNTPSVQVQIESAADELHGDVEVVEDYGKTTNPPADVTEGIGLFVAGESDHGLVIGWMDKLHRPKGLEPGEVCFYAVFGQRIKFDKLGQVLITDQTGSTVLLDASGDIVQTPSSGILRVNGTMEVSGGINAVGAITTAGSVNAVGDVIGDGVSLSNHVHPGVQPGMGNTGAPI
ncbi:MAG: phage baseplate assembly protein V [Pseudomonadota bacterium]